jgi:uncharacterized transporter YbjL
MRQHVASEANIVVNKCDSLNHLSAKVLDMRAELLKTQPEIGLLLCITAGYALGSIRVGLFQCGGVSGKQIVALARAQSGARIASDLKSIPFTRFIFALDFISAPSFFSDIASDGDTV